MPNASTEPELATTDDDLPVEMSPKNHKVAFTLACLLGFSGAHRFYLGRPLTATAMLLSGGGFLIWWFLDVFLILSGQFRDAQGRPLGRPRHIKHIDPED